MNNPAMWLIAVWTALSSAAATGHEITTHGLITDHAYRISALNPESPNNISRTLGFDRLDQNYPFSFDGASGRVFYYDEVAIADPGSIFPVIPINFRRPPQQQEGNVLNNLVSRSLLPGAPGQAVEQRVRSWLLRGAVREDDNDFIFFGWHNGDDRDLDPHGRILRAARHFYDPLYSRAFDHADECQTYGCVASIQWALGRVNPLLPSLNIDDTSRRNHFTWQDARNNYWWALTLKRDILGSGWDVSDAIASSGERLDRWATTIKSLGHVIHLLQDTSQPQHVRNDAHGPPVDASGAEGEADAAFEAFTDYRVLRNRSEALGLTLGGNPLRRMLDDTLPTENNLPRINLGESNYYPGGGGRVQFSTPVKFFTTRHIEQGCNDASLRSWRGLADLSNRSFFTSGTLPGFRENPQPVVPPGGCDPNGGPTYPLPPNDLAASGYTEVLIQGGLLVHGRVVHLAEYTHPITDVVAPGYDQAVGTLAAYGGKAPLVTKGIWHSVLPDDLRTQYLESTGYLITYNNMRYMADAMLPRAVGYSAGMIDFFFRGRLTVSPPPAGLYAVADQGTPHTVDADGYPRASDQSVFGFHTLRARVKNNTADIVESGTGTVVPQIAKSGRLVAIARYHRNPCYKPNLSGEYVTLTNGSSTVPAGCSLAQSRTTYQEISVSAPLMIDANGNFPGTNNGWNPCANVGNLSSGSTGSCAHADGVLGEFDFSADPIPINATDLFLQVAYRGELGEEADGIAVGIKDILEPNYFTVWNNADWYLDNGVWTASSIPNPFIAPPGPLTTSIVCFNNQLIAGLASGQQLNPARFYRTAVLADIKPLQFGVIHVFNGQVSAGSDGAMPSLQRQADTELGANYAPSPIPYYGRGTPLGMDYNLFYQQRGNATAAQYFAVLNLLPALGDPLTPGIAMPVGSLFSSSPESNCAAYFPGPYPGGASAITTSAEAADASGGAKGGHRLH